MSVETLNLEPKVTAHEPLFLGGIAIKRSQEIERTAIENEKAHIGKIQTASVVVGTEACNARCRFCVSKMTPEQGITLKRPHINWQRFDTFMEYAQAGHAEAAMLTGKGEPTLFAEDITDYLQRVADNERRLGFAFGAKELQTNGLLIAQKPGKFDPLLAAWAELGLTTMAVSIVHYDPEINRQEYTPYKQNYIDLPGLIRQIHCPGIGVRLSCTLLDGGIDSSEKLHNLIEFARINDVEQLTIRPVNKPQISRSDDVSAFIQDRYLKESQYADVAGYLTRTGIQKETMQHGAQIYDVFGQNVCLSNCLTTDEIGHHRQLISYPEGVITTDWTSTARQLP